MAASAPASRRAGRDASLKGVSTQQNTPSSSPSAGPEKPGRIALVAALNALEGAALVIGGIYMLVMGLLGSPDSPQQAEMGGLTLLVLGLIPLFAARGLLLRRSWSRGPALITQIMALPVAWTLLRAQGALIPVGIALAVVAVTALVLLLSPATTQALGIRGPRTTPGA
ncbi:hypothetical protein GCM10010392_05550 [Streptomyces clavifer]|nr:hypothetical protein GCM10010392_05550 [Streptomyces clavifer]